MGLPALRRTTYDEYLDLERRSGQKHEFADGEVFAMAGGTADHALIAMNLGSALRVALRGSPCRPFTSDWKLWLDAANRATYPDVSVICGPIQRPPHDPDAATNPTLIAEVLAPSTEDHDRGTKSRDYRRLPSLQHLLLVDSARVHVELSTRNPDGTWTLREHGPGATIHLPALGLSLTVDALYEDTELRAAAVNPPDTATTAT